MKKVNFLFLTLLMLCMLSGNMNAQELVETRISNANYQFIPSPTSPVIVCAGEETSFDQSTNQSTSGIISTLFSPPGDVTLDTESADDFTISEARLLSGVTFFGFSNTTTGPYNSVTITVYDDNGGSPGANVMYQENFTSDAAGAAIGDMSQLYIPVEVSLAAGTYWLSVQMHDDDRWNWFANNTATPGGEGIAHLRNPGGGFGTGTDWNSLPSLGVTFSQLAFDLDFCPAPVPVTGGAVPTMSQWGLFLFALVSMTLGMVFMYRMETEKAVAGMSMSASTSNSLPFNMEVFQASMKHALGLAVVGFALILLGWGEIVPADLVGMMISIPVVAYMIHLAKMMKK